MPNTTKQKREREVIILGWLVLSFAAYLFYMSISILGEYFLMPFTLVDILTRANLDFKIKFFVVAITHIFSIILLIAAIGVLCLKRWAFILLVLIFILDFTKRFYVLIKLTHQFSVIFTIEAVLLAITIYCLCIKKIRETLK